MDTIPTTCEHYPATLSACINEFTLAGGFTPGSTYHAEFTTAMGRMYDVPGLVADPQGAILIPVDGDLKRNWNEYSGGLLLQIRADGQKCPYTMALTDCDSYGAVTVDASAIYISIVGGSAVINSI